MKVVAGESFFKSLKDCFGIKGKINSIRCWIEYHFTKGFWKLVKEVFKSYPYDHSYILYLEKAKIIEMADYIEKMARYQGYEKDVKWMRIAAKLIDIITEDGMDLFHYNGKLEYVSFEDEKYGTLYEVKHSPDFEYVCNVNVNTRNIHRFFKEYEPIDYYKEHKHEVYLRKARYLYHKIRLYYEEQWWD